LEIKTLIPFFGIKRQYANLRKEILDALDKVYSTGQVLDGHYTKEFEKQIAKKCHRKYAVAVNSCSQGLIFAQQVLFLENTKILIPTISFVSTINSVLLNGNEPVLCDTDDQALINLESVDYALKGAGVQGVMYVNIFGNTVNWDRFKMTTDFFNNDLKIIEDAAQSFGASYKGVPSGAMGDISVLSFDPTKNLNNYGSGGMVLTDDLNFANTLMDLRDNGKTSGHEIPGTNSKMSESDCAQMLVKLKHFDSWQSRRTQIAEYYNAELNDYVDIPKTTEGTVHAWHKYVIKLNDRTGLKHHLAIKGVETKIHYEQPLFEHPVGWDYVDYARDIMRGSTAHSKEALSLPIYPELTDLEVEYIIDQLLEIV
jgi:dTDP-4-amino-4,6-dideoxygalactose transaminase